MGNLVKRVGSGSPRRMIACAMDVPAFVVSGITGQGYLRLHRTGVAAHPLWDQFHEAHQLRILTTRGEVTGVVAIANGHFARQHRGDTTVVGVDQLWVDVGASTKAQAAVNPNRKCVGFTRGRVRRTIDRAAAGTVSIAFRCLPINRRP